MKIKVENGVVHLPDSFEPENAEIVLCPETKGVIVILEENFKEFTKKHLDGDSPRMRAIRRYFAMNSVTAEMKDRKICLTPYLAEKLPDGYAELKVGEKSIVIRPCEEKTSE